MSADDVVRQKIRDNSVVDAAGCWLWTRARNRHDYGVTSYFGGSRLAHRVSYEAFVGPIPSGLVIDHLCRVPRCVNPAHMEPVTVHENTMRGVSPSAAQAKQTECKEGHPLSGENLLPESRGRRLCVICTRRWSMQRAEILRRAARAKGLGVKEYRSTYGFSIKTAEAVLAGAL